MGLIKFHKWFQHGRLGNAVLQWLAMIGIAEANKRELIVPHGWEYRKYFKTPPREAVWIGSSVVKEKHYHYDESLLNLPVEAEVLGWLQSPRYYKREHLAQLAFTDELLQRTRPEPGTLAISIRRGKDMLDNPRYSVPPIEYYVSALVTHFLDYQQRPIMIFSDDLDYCKIHFDCLPNARYATGMSDIEQLAAISQCSDFIISHSTFSYCGALLADKGKVIRPRWIFSETYRAQNSEKDFWPTKEWLGGREWQVHDPAKLDLKDCTFTIPVMHDHPDRQANLNLSVCLLQRQFETNIVVGEQGTDKFGYMSSWCRYQKFPYEHFHRTRMLNQMAVQTDTPYVYNWDADNIVPLLQVWLSVQRLREGADMVYPFDGRIARMQRQEWFKRMERSLDVGIVGPTRWTGKAGLPQVTTSVGHGVVVNKTRFLESGGENEYFISYGPEDHERFERWQRLGYRVERVRGTMYHMDHWIGVDSGIRNPFFNANAMELKRERAMTNEELRAYANSFPWRHKYDQGYYDTIVDGARESARIVYAELEKLIGPIKSVVDIGAGVGEWEYTKDYTGIDFNSPNPEIGQHDLRTPLRLQRRFDLALCLEVAEHLPQESAGVLIESLSQLAPYILFSAAIPKQGGESHVNEQWPDYWAKLFKRFGFHPYPIDIRDSIWENDKVEVWYRQNMVLFHKGEAGNYWLRRVHPVMWQNHVWNSTPA